MKPANLIKPSWWYLVAAIPLATTCFLSHRFLEAESYKYTFGGLRVIFVLMAVQFPQLMGGLAVIGFGVFAGSTMTTKLHNLTLLRIFSTAALILYGFWSFQMIVWVAIK